MKIIIHDKNAKLTGADREYCEEKFLKLAKYVNAEPTIAEAHFEKQRGLITLHVTITHPHEKLPDHFDEQGHGCREVVDLVKERVEEHLRRRQERQRPSGLRHIWRRFFAR
ncbi:HPF/RaiA family ribosome-associated protein [Candidatus Berkelbacteria bacterium]|nr:HPF/RaiA family ribosome-associated protein [Candidatus Berkelbacteria bacterium]